MKPPIMKVASFGVSFLGKHLQSYGHRIELVDDPAQVRGSDLVLISEQYQADEFVRLAGSLAHYTHAGQMLLHSHPRFGLEPFLDAVEYGALGLACFPVNEELVTLSANGEIAEEVGVLMLGQCGLDVKAVAEEQLPAVLAKLAYYHLCEGETRQAASALGFGDVVDKDYLPGMFDPYFLEQSYQHLHRDEQQAFTLLLCQTARRLGSHDAEWWGMSHLK